MPKFFSDSLLSQDLVSTVQESLLYYYAGVTLLATQYGVASSCDDKVSLIWTVFIMYRFIASGPRMSLLRVGQVITVDVLFLSITQIRWFQIVLAIVCDILLCMKCLVLWRYVSCPTQTKDAEKSSNSQNDEENPTGPSEAI